MCSVRYKSNNKEQRQVRPPACHNREEGAKEGGEENPETKKLEDPPTPPHFAPC